MNPNSNASISDLGGYPPVIEADVLGKLLGKSVLSIRSDRCRAPHRLPPACTPPDTKTPLWILSDVLAWLAQYREPAAQAPDPSKKFSAPQFALRRRGKPSKAETVEAQRLGLSVREFRAQRALELGEGGGV